MSTNLLHKLRMMDAANKRVESIASEQNIQHLHECPTDETDPFYYTKESFPLSLFGERKHCTADHLSSIFGVQPPPLFNHEDLLFFDTETTGLSGGAGTLAFQIGLGYFSQSHFIIEQFLIRDYPEEPAMLREVAARMSRFSVLVSFNGRTFDAPLLTSRLLINRLSTQCLPDVHTDLLFPARRLWKLRLKSCRLSHLEEAILGIHREDDLPGAQVPQTYFQYLKDKKFYPLERILRHNQQDIVSLAQLFFFLCKEVANPEGIHHEQDLLSLARHYEKKGDVVQSTKCYRLCARGDTRAQAFSALAAVEKKRGQVDAAIRLYTAMLKRGDNPLHACEALAKLFEHQKKDLKSAMHYTRQALLLTHEPDIRGDSTVQDSRIALQYRYTRLRRKLDASSQNI